MTAFEAAPLIKPPALRAVSDFDLQTSHVIPALIRKFCHAVETGATQVEIWGTGAPSREFFYVQDCARAIVMATEQYDGPEPVNLGANFEITIKALAEKIRQLTGFRGELVWDKTKPDGQPRRCLDVSRAKDYFGFAAQMPFEQGLKETIQWWKERWSRKLNTKVARLNQVCKS